MRALQVSDLAQIASALKKKFFEETVDNFVDRFR
jgi:hypothetical protein